MKTKLNLFLDSSALLAGLVSAGHAAQVLLLLGASGHVGLTTSHDAIQEIEHTLARLAPQTLDAFRQALQDARVRVLPGPSPEEVAAHSGLVSPPADLPIVLAAKHSGAGCLVTVTRRHFFTDTEVPLRTGLATADPAGALVMVRQGLLGTNT